MHNAPARRYSWRSWSLLCLLSLIWGSSFILMKRSLTVFTPVEVSTLRIFSAAVVFLPTGLLQLRRLHWRQAAYLLLMGTVGILSPALLFAYAQTQLDSALNGALTAMAPLFTLIVGVAGFRQPISWHQVGGILLGLSGTLLLIFADAGQQWRAVNYYALLPIIGCLGYGIKSNLIEHRLSALRSHTITAVAFLLIGGIAGAVLFTQTAFVTKLCTAHGAQRAAGYVLVLGVLGSAAAYWLVTVLVKRTSPVFASMVSFLIPVVALAWGLLDGEVLRIYHYVGLGAILLGVYWVSKR